MNPLSQKSEPPPWRFYQNIRPNTKNKRGLKALSYFLPRKGLKEADPAKGWVKKCPVDTFLGRGESNVLKAQPLDCKIRTILFFHDSLFSYVDIPHANGETLPRTRDPFSQKIARFIHTNSLLVVT